MKPYYLIAIPASLTKPLMALMLFLCRRKGKKCFAFGGSDDKLILAPTRLPQGPLLKNRFLPPAFASSLRWAPPIFNPLAFICLLTWEGQGRRLQTTPTKKLNGDTALMKHSTLNEPTYYGLDVHQNAISIARCTAETKSPEYITTIVNDPEKIKAFFKEELKKYPWIQSAYEAGACGYHIHHTLLSIGIDSQVVAPTKIPTQRVRGLKNDKRDSMHLAKCLHNQDLTSIYIPDEAQLDMRELTRQREALMKDIKQAKNRVYAFLRRLGIRYTQGKTSWTQKYRQWLNTLKLDTPVQQKVFNRFRQGVDDLYMQLEETDKDIHELRQASQHREVIKGLMAIRGVGEYTAAALVGEVGNFSRFETAGEFMSYLGLTPNELSSGERVPGSGINRDKLKQGGITKAGNGRLRRLLVEAAWHAHHRPRKDAFKHRWEGLPQAVIDHAWKAQLRLYRKKQNMTTAHKSSQKTNIAVARELAGFIWWIGCLMEQETSQHQKAA
jgi:transposase